jgi:hypothetical protein
MLKDGVVLLVICLIVVGGILVRWTQSPTHSLSTAEPQIPESKTALKTAPTVAKSSPKPKPTPAPAAEESTVVDATPSPQVAAAVPVVHADPPPFPAVEKIATGLREDFITSTYGNPALSSVTSTGGHMVETFVYARDNGRLATIIRLEDGKVSAAYSQSEAVHAAGLSAPPRWRNE